MNRRDIFSLLGALPVALVIPRLARASTKRPIWEIPPGFIVFNRPSTLFDGRPDRYDVFFSIPGHGQHLYGVDIAPDADSESHSIALKLLQRGVRNTIEKRGARSVQWQHGWMKS